MQSLSKVSTQLCTALQQASSLLLGHLLSSDMSQGEQALADIQQKQLLPVTSCEPVVCCKLTCSPETPGAMI